MSYHKISRKAAAAIKRKRKAGALLKELAAEIGCSISAIRYVINGRYNGRRSA